MPVYSTTFGTHSLKKEIASAKRKKEPKAKVIHLEHVVAIVLGEIFRNFNKSKEANLKAYLKNNGMELLPLADMLGESLSIYLASKITGKTWSYLSAAEHIKVIPRNITDPLKKLASIRNSMLHDIDGVKKPKGNELKEMVRGVEAFIDWAGNKGFVEQGEPSVEAIKVSTPELTERKKDKGEGDVLNVTSTFPALGGVCLLRNFISVMGAGVAADKYMPKRSSRGEMSEKDGDSHVEVKKTKTTKKMRQKSKVSSAAKKSSYAETLPGLFSRKSENVKNLTDLFIMHLSDAERRKLIDELKENDDYKGPNHYLLYEYCFKKDPTEILAEQFSIYKLRTIAERLGFEDRNPSKNVCIEYILKQSGFSVPIKPKGISFVLDFIKRTERKFRHAREKEEIIGIIQSVNKEIERILNVNYFFSLTTIIIPHG